jgi:hypothetical protein
MRPIYVRTETDCCGDGRHPAHDASWEVVPEVLADAGEVLHCGYPKRRRRSPPYCEDTLPACRFSPTIDKHKLLQKNYPFTHLANLVA